MEASTFLKKMSNNDWQVSRKAIIKSDVIIDGAAESRLSKCPREFIDFICSFQTLTTYEESVWFLSYYDYKSHEEEVFPWNEFELQSLDSADEDSKEAIKVFWKNHIPFAMSVKGGHSYIAICTDEENYGKIYQGSEPEFEKVTLVADDLADFLEKFSQLSIAI